MEKLSPELGFELLKLLVQLAWSDLDMSPHEATFILELCAQLCPGEEPQGEVLSWINGEQMLTAPNLGQLKKHPDLVMKTMAQLSLSDGKLVEDEREMLKLVAEMLT